MFISAGISGLHIVIDVDVEEMLQKTRILQCLCVKEAIITPCGISG